MDLHKQGRCYFSRLWKVLDFWFYLFSLENTAAAALFKAGRGGVEFEEGRGKHTHTHPSNTKFNETRDSVCKMGRKSILTYLVEAHHPSKRFSNVCL